MTSPKLLHAPPLRLHTIVLTWVAAMIGAVAISGCAPEVASETPHVLDVSTPVVPPVPPVTTAFWESHAPMGTARSKSLAVEVAGKIYVVGGDDGTTVFSTVEEYDIASDTWTNCGGGCASMPTAVTQAAGGPQDGLVFVIGGFTTVGGGGPTNVVQVYDPGSNAWINTCSGNPCDAINGGQLAQVASASAGGSIYLSGGNAGPSSIFTYFDEAQTPGSMLVSCPPLPCLPGGVGRSRAGSAISGDILYLLGGYDGGGYVATLFAFDTLSLTWTNCGGNCPDIPQDPVSLLTGGMDAVMAASSGVVYAMGLNTNSSEDYVQSFDTATSTWTNCGGTCPRIPIAIGGPGSAQVGNRLYLIGGNDGGAASTHNQVLVMP